MTNARANATTGTLLAEAMAIFRRNSPLLLMAGAVVGAIDFGQTIEDRERLAGAVGVVLAAIVTILAQMAVEGIVARSVLVREGLADAGVPARFGAYMGVAVLTLLGIIFGVVLLVVPGILLALRWALASNFTLARDMGVLEALEASRDSTKGHRVDIFGAYFVFGVVIYAPLLVMVPFAGGLDALNSADPWSPIGALRVAWTIFMTMVGLAVNLGMFSVLVGRHGRLQEVFA